MRTIYGLVDQSGTIKLAIRARRGTAVARSNNSACPVELVQRMFPSFSWRLIAITRNRDLYTSLARVSLDLF